MTGRDRFLKWFLYALGVVPVWVLETAVLNRMPLFGIIPVLLPLTAVAAGLWEGPLPGAVFGLCVGMVADATYPGVPGGMTVLCAFVGWLSGVVSSLGVKQNLVGYLLCSTGAMAVLEAARVAGALFIRLSTPLPILRVAGIEGLWSLCFTLPIYGLFKLIYRWVGGDRLGGTSHE